MRWGFIGASSIAERVITSLKKLPDQQLVGVCSRSATRAAAFAQQQGVASAHTELDALLALRPDAVYISSTNEQHHAQTLAALAAGCHVMCEKPLAMSLADAAQMLAAARSANRVLATNHHLRSHAAHLWMRSAIAAGQIGRVHGVQVSHAVYLPPHLQGWRLDAPGAGGGVVMDILVHNADLLRFLLGSEPQRIHTVTQRNGLAQGALEDGAMSVIEFDGGVLAQTHESFVAQHAQTRLHVLGTEGSLYAEGSLSQAGSARLWWRSAAGEQEIAVPTVDLYEVGFGAFVRACAGDGAPLATGADGERSLAVALAGLESAAHGNSQAIAARP
ncbi:MAG: Gfo/Idh/MocA family protein [Leptothrix sp. (in: b-proteobacteria)]